ISSYHLLTLVLAFGVIVLIFGETIITAPFAACFLYQKDQHALVYSQIYRINDGNVKRDRACTLAS
ncbi:hypothetical protein, partial [Xenorhabdus sp. Sc-CR9]|uniref:hypothetical protein n=1 Tax=Xenorhabdus sp. Sc-CR9 TaxID=2584468 RepID=UPI001F27FC83